MSVLRWWFVDVPEWGWENVARGGHSLAGVGVFAVSALAYAAVNLAAAGGLLGGLAALARRRGRPVSGG
ncbi:hypothetical protein [Streptomyces sp. 3214.6]|uniref:hypothetical protein n=1 Tax=Streptomyces sp. 3214.6 TaxID=1882757 RepID=UPI00090C9831|nr:hypothetical protein [Streptomyces sp. 3214.6]SHI68329.1 hypothetical protein SAMN05444521_8227 [Streptomyces sp. 3214.6]